MTSNLKESAKRVQDYLTKKGFSLDVKELATSTRTAREAADSIGCKVEQIAKSLVFKDQETESPVLIVASGTNRVDTGKVEAVTGIRLGRVGGDYVKKETGFGIGGIPPAGHTTRLRTLLDQDLKQYDVIWAAAGTPFAVFRLTPSDLETLTQGRWLDLSE